MSQQASQQASQPVFFFNLPKLPASQPASQASQLPAQKSLKVHHRSPGCGFFSSHSCFEKVTEEGKFKIRGKLRRRESSKSVFHK
jgi:hypothetical protein